MCIRDRIYSDYFFELNKGYGTKKHIEKLNSFKPCPIHRKTYLQIKNFFKHNR